MKPANSNHSMRVKPGVLLAAGLLAACGSPAPAGDDSAAGANAAVVPAVAPDSAGRAERAGTIPASFHGTYDASREACGRASEYRLTVSARELRFHESIGVVRTVTVEGPEAIQVDADYQGEGESWRAAQRLRLADGGARLTITGEGVNLTRARCGRSAAIAVPAGAGWQASASGEGAALFLPGPGGGRRLTLLCPAESGDLVVNVPAFRAVGSEERMSFGAGGTAVILVADVRGDAGRGGVTGRGPVPDELPAILAAAQGIAVNYGTQGSGPHASPPADLARSFVAACGG